MKKLLILSAALPLLQLSQCQTGLSQVSLNVLNRTPQAAFYSLLQVLIPDLALNPALIP